MKKTLILGIAMAMCFVIPHMIGTALVTMFVIAFQFGTNWYQWLLAVQYQDEVLFNGETIEAGQKFSDYMHMRSLNYIISVTCGITLLISEIIEAGFFAVEPLFGSELIAIAAYLLYAALVVAAIFYRDSIFRVRVKKPSMASSIII